MSKDRDIVTWIGLGIVGAAAAILSFSALSDLGRLVGMTGTLTVGDWTFHLAWLLPIAVDVFAAVATRVWLRGRAAPDVIASARRSAWGAIITTVGGNAYHGYLTGAGRLDAVIVGAIPAVALGRLVHLAALRGRPAGEERAVEPGRIVRWRAKGAAWWEMRKAERAAADARRAGAGETGRAAGGPTIPTGADSNDVLAADLRRLNAARRAGGDDPLGRDAVRERYRIGSGRADTVRALAEQPPSPARPRLVHDDGEEAAG